LESSVTELRHWLLFAGQKLSHFTERQNLVKQHLKRKLSKDFVARKFRPRRYKRGGNHWRKEGLSELWQHWIISERDS